MKTYKWLGATGAVVALAAAGFVAAPQAQGAITITAGQGSRVTCNIAGAAKISPALANDWKQSEHSGGNADPNSNATVKAAMASIPDFTYSAGVVPVTTAAKVASTSCSGSVTDGTNTSTVTGASIGSASVSAGTTEATCGGLASPGTSTYQTIIKWTGATAKITPSTITATLGILADAHGIGFQLTSGPADVTGSFASSGSHSVSNAYVDGGTIGAITASPPTFDSPTAGVCEPTLKPKFTAASAGVSDAVAVKVSKPKGFKGVGITTANGDATPSNLCIQSTTTAACPT